MNQPKQKTNGILIIHADTAIGGGTKATGLGVIIRDERGNVLRMARRRLEVMTNNEAEYAAVVFALEEARRMTRVSPPRSPERDERTREERAREIRLHSDSRVVIEQMRGEISVHSPSLRRWHQRARALAREFRRLTFTHVSREDTRLTDALANEALKDILDFRFEGRPIRNLKC